MLMLTTSAPLLQNPISGSRCQPHYCQYDVERSLRQPLGFLNARLKIVIRHKFAASFHYKILRDMPKKDSLKKGILLQIYSINPAKGLSAKDQRALKIHKQPNGIIF
jgi:hypothetical protein